ncbi:UNVERIFIED_CONTAM: hypothetical protein Sindi_1394200 [Sesamum indicum]
MDHTVTPFDVDAHKEGSQKVSPTPAPLVARDKGLPSQIQRDVPPWWIARLECLQKDLQNPFSEEIMADELLLNWKEPNLPEYDGTTDLQEHLSYFENIALLHRYTPGVKYRVFITTFTRSAQQWSNQSSSRSIRSFGEFRYLFLH